MLARNHHLLIACLFIVACGSPKSKAQKNKKHRSLAASLLGTWRSDVLPVNRQTQKDGIEPSLWLQFAEKYVEFINTTSDLNDDDCIGVPQPYTAGAIMVDVEATENCPASSFFVQQVTEDILDLIHVVLPHGEFFEQMQLKRTDAQTFAGRKEEYKSEVQLRRQKVLESTSAESPSTAPASSAGATSASTSPVVPAAVPTAVSPLVLEAERLLDFTWSISEKLKITSELQTRVSGLSQEERKRVADVVFRFINSPKSHAPVDVIFTHERLREQLAFLLRESLSSETLHILLDLHRQDRLSSLEQADIALLQSCGVLVGILNQSENTPDADAAVSMFAGWIRQSLYSDEHLALRMSQVSSVVQLKIWNVLIEETLLEWQKKDGSHLYRFLSEWSKRSLVGISDLNAGLVTLLKPGVRRTIDDHQRIERITLFLFELLRISEGDPKAYAKAAPALILLAGSAARVDDVINNNAIRHLRYLRQKEYEFSGTFYRPEEALLQAAQYRRTRSHAIAALKWRYREKFGYVDDLFKSDGQISAEFARVLNEPEMVVMISADSNMGRQKINADVRYSLDQLLKIQRDEVFSRIKVANLQIVSSSASMMQAIGTRPDDPIRIEDKSKGSPFPWDVEPSKWDDVASQAKFAILNSSGSKKHVEFWKNLAGSISFLSGESQSNHVVIVNNELNLFVGSASGSESLLVAKASVEWLGRPGNRLTVYMLKKGNSWFNEERFKILKERDFAFSYQDEGVLKQVPAKKMSNVEFVLIGTDEENADDEMRKLLLGALSEKIFLPAKK